MIELPAPASDGYVELHCTHCNHPIYRRDGFTRLPEKCPHCFKKLMQARHINFKEPGAVRCRYCGVLCSDRMTADVHQIDCPQKEAYLTKQTRDFEIKSLVWRTKLAAKKKTSKPKPKPIAVPADVPHCKSCGSTSVKILNRRGRWLHCSKCQSSEQLAAKCDSATPSPQPAL
jgi:phage FluMu protein Com